MRILIVCMGNICRSPVVEAVLREHAARGGVSLDVASAGTENYHIGSGADERSIASASRRGYDLSLHRARQVSTDDFETFDHLLVMDRVNFRALSARAPSGHSQKVAMFLEFAGLKPPHEVPDPYYGSARDFERVIDLAESGAQALIDRWSHSRTVHSARATNETGIVSR